MNLLHREFPYALLMYRSQKSQETRKLFRADFFVWFSGPVSSFLNYRKPFILGARNFHFRNIRHSLRVGSFYFSSTESYFLKDKRFPEIKEKTVSWNVNFFSGFPKYKKSFLLRKYKKFLNIRVRKIHVVKYKKI